MSLTSEQELEMYSDIKVIKQLLENHQNVQNDHEKRITILEHGFWIFVGICLQECKLCFEIIHIIGQT